MFQSIFFPFLDLKTDFSEEFQICSGSVRPGLVSARSHDQDSRIRLVETGSSKTSRQHLYSGENLFGLFLRRHEKVLLTKKKFSSLDDCSKISLG
jgi:hypothetical protein